MIEFTDNTFAGWQRDVLDASESALVVAYFTAPWCGPCRMLKPTLEKLEAENEGLTVVRIDVDSNPELAREFRIMSVPQLWFYKAGSQVVSEVGIRQKPYLQDIIDRYV